MNYIVILYIRIWIEPYKDLFDLKTYKLLSKYITLPIKYLKSDLPSPKNTILVSFFCMSHYVFQSFVFRSLIFQSFVFRSFVFCFKLVFSAFATSIQDYKTTKPCIKLCKYYCSMASKQINIRWIATGSQPYCKIMYSIVLQTILHKY